MDKKLLRDGKKYFALNIHYACMCRHPWSDPNSNRFFDLKVITLLQLTLSSNQNNGYFGSVPIMWHFRVVSVDSIEARFILQAEHENYGVDPSGELWIEQEVAIINCLQNCLRKVKSTAVSPKIIYCHQYTLTCISGAPPSSRISSK